METIIVQDKDAALLDMLTSALEIEGFEVVSLNTCDEKLILEQIDKTKAACDHARHPTFRTGLHQCHQNH